MSKPKFAYRTDRSDFEQLPKTPQAGCLAAVAARRKQFSREPLSSDETSLLEHFSSLRGWLHPDGFRPADNISQFEEALGGHWRELRDTTGWSTSDQAAVQINGGFEVAQHLDPEQTEFSVFLGRDGHAASDIDYWWKVRRVEMAYSFDPAVSPGSATDDLAICRRLERSIKYDFQMQMLALKVWSDTPGIPGLPKVQPSEASLRKQLANYFVSYPALQASLTPKEAFVMYTAIDDDVLIWAISDKNIMVRRSPGARTVINKRAAALNRELSSVSSDLRPARDLYNFLLEPVEDIIKDRAHLIISPTGNLFATPWAALLTTDGEYFASPTIKMKDWPWLGVSKAITVVPSPAYLVNVRGNSVEGRAPMKQGYLGFGDPILRSKGRAPKNAARLLTLSEIYRSGALNVAAFEELEPLPETKAELVGFAATVGSGHKAIYTGSSATKHELLNENESGELKRYGTLHFATHGIVSGEMRGAQEPGLVLSSFDEDGKAIDGFLKASDIARLRMDADLVLLSACNTSAGLRGDQDAMGGLVKAFILAGARAVVATLWSVESQSTTDLIVSVGQQRQQLSVSLSEAMRVARKKFIAADTGERVHPYYWAAFVSFGMP